MRRVLIVLMVASGATFFCATGGASAAVTFGAPAYVGSGGNHCGLPGQWCTFVADGTAAADATAPISGVITSFRLGYSGDSTLVSLMVLTPTGTPDQFVVQPDATLVQPPSTSDPAGETLNVPARVKVAAGDRIAVGWVDLSTTPSPLQAATGQSCALIVHTPPPIGSPSDWNASCTGAEPALGATIEADADGDGYGDESQDACPTDPARQSACVKPSVHLLRAARQRLASLDVTESVATQSTVTTTASVKVGKKTYSSSPVHSSLAAGEAKLVRLKFARRAKRSILASLRGHRRLKALITSTDSDSTGSAVATTTVKLTR